MPEPRQLLIDGSRFEDLEGFWDEVQRAWGLAPGSWGRNVDAFEDIADSMPEGTVVRWVDASRSRVVLGHPATVRWLEERLPKVHPSNRAEFSKRLEHARQARGETLFDMLVDVLESAPSTFELVERRPGAD